MEINELKKKFNIARAFLYCSILELSRYLITIPTIEYDEKLGVYKFSIEMVNDFAPVENQVSYKKEISIRNHLLQNQNQYIENILKEILQNEFKIFLSEYLYELNKITSLNGNSSWIGSKDKDGVIKDLKRMELEINEAIEKDTKNFIDKIEFIKSESEKQLLRNMFERLFKPKTSTVEEFLKVFKGIEL